MKRPLIFFYGLFCFLFILPLFYHLQAKILINEVLPYPEDGNEAIELIFISDVPQETELNLKDWSIWDELTSPSCLYTFEEEIIKTGDFLVKTFNNKLNNSGDSIIIKNPSGEITDKFAYSFSEKDFSYSRISHNQDDFILSIPTLGNANIIPSPTLIPTLTPTTNEIQSEGKIAKDDKDQSHDNFRENITDDSTESFKLESNHLQKNLEDLHNQQEDLVQRIQQMNSAIKNNHNHDFHIAKPSNTNQFITTLKYEVSIISKIGVVGVIIGGLFFLIASKIIYE